MGVYIKSLDMPFCCLVCPCSGTDSTDDGDEVWVCEASKLRRLTTEDKIERRPEWCPLVPVPPHGRLIDADNLALLVLNLISTQEKAYPYEDSNALAWRLGAKAMGNQIYRDIKAYPTIIPAEEEE